jgi:methylmalonyl-CoA/ethylmalonyl-CoA epimerase
MLSAAMDAGPVRGPVLPESSGYIRERQRLSLTYASSVGNASRRVLWRAHLFSNSSQAHPKLGILRIFPEYKQIKNRLCLNFVYHRKGGCEMAEKLKANYVDHICIAVNDVKKAEKDYIDAFGWEVAYRYVDEPEKIRVTGFMVGPTAIEIMEDLDGTGEVAKFIRRAGEGVMLISYNVDNCEESLELLKRNKVRLIDQKPRWFAEYKRNFAFIHPAATHGILTEIIDGKY